MSNLPGTPKRGYETVVVKASVVIASEECWTCLLVSPQINGLSTVLLQIYCGRGSLLRDVSDPRSGFKRLIFQTRPQGAYSIISVELVRRRLKPIPSFGLSTT